MRHFYTQEVAENKFQERNITLISKYQNCTTPVTAKCFCGTIFTVKPCHIFNKNTSSCGCKIKTKSRYPSKIGQKFGLLTVLKRSKEHNKRWICQCECGNVVTIRIRPDRDTNSCGCLKNKSCGEIPLFYWSNIKYRAKSKGLELNVTPEYLWNIFLKQNRQCSYTGIELIFTDLKNQILQTASIDRIDSNKGYIEGNVQWVHKLVNTMKLDLDHEDFLKWCQLVSKFNESKKMLANSGDISPKSL